MAKSKYYGLNKSAVTCISAVGKEMMERKIWPSLPFSIHIGPFDSVKVMQPRSKDPVQNEIDVGKMITDLVKVIEEVEMAFMYATGLDYNQKNVTLAICKNHQDPETREMYLDLYSDRAKSLWQ
jgi:hypothetical protein